MLPKFPFEDLHPDAASHDSGTSLIQEIIFAGLQLARQVIFSLVGLFTHLTGSDKSVICNSKRQDTKFLATESTLDILRYTRPKTSNVKFAIWNEFPKKRHHDAKFHKTENSLDLQRLIER